MARLVSLTTRPAIGSVRFIPQLILPTRATHRAQNGLSLDASSSNYIDAMYEQWSKDPQSVHKV